MIKVCENCGHDAHGGRTKTQLGLLCYLCLRVWDKAYACGRASTVEAPLEPEVGAFRFVAVAVDGRVIDGHMRLAAARELGCPQAVPVEEVDP